MKAILNRLTQHETLQKEEASSILFQIAKGAYNPSQIASFLTVFMMRSITLEELEGFREALLELCVAIDLSEFTPIDLCGTGGDGKDTFNISTLSSFITAGAGVKVAKHGNYGVSSGCGSSNVLEHLGIKFSNEEDFLRRCIDQAGICVLHAPLFHPAMKNVAPIRRELGVKTFFNMLGPLVNPAFPKNQLTGVFNLELARLYGYLFQKTDQNFTILYALDGYDEISLTGPARAIRKSGESTINPQDFGVEPLSEKQITGGDTVSSSAAIFMSVLDGKGTTAQNNVVSANAAMAIATATDCTPIEGFEKAKISLMSGKAYQAFKTLQKLSAA
ncbi:MAG: anthranilate phosphoribosyltransferase [Bacteroidota bacterium]|nr:anthranilate phosphoribosyltransferase [Bacteroidota bacterium]